MPTPMTPESELAALRGAVREYRRNYSQATTLNPSDSPQRWAEAVLRATESLNALFAIVPDEEIEAMEAFVAASAAVESFGGNDDAGPTSLQVAAPGELAMRIAEAVDKKFRRAFSSWGEVAGAAEVISPFIVGIVEERDRLRAALPKTADGVPIVPGMRVWGKTDDETGYPFLIENFTLVDRTIEPEAYAWGLDAVLKRHPKIYSTQAAAIAAGERRE